MELNLKDKVALVTGSSKGIGLAIAKKLHAEGCLVVLNARDEVRLKSAVAALGPHASGFTADVTRPEDCALLADSVIRKHGRLDILVCNVGSGVSVEAGAETNAEWLRVLHLNFLSATNMVEVCRAHLAATKGRVVCVSSICGHEVIPGAPLTYTVAKTALNTYVKGVARALAGQGVRINAVSPGNILFEGSVWERKLAQTKTATEAMLRRDVALGRFGAPEEIADFVAFLVSDRSAFVTGSVHVVDGGQTRA